MGLEFTKKNGGEAMEVRVHHKKERWGESSPGRKSDGVRVHNE